MSLRSVSESVFGKQSIRLTEIGNRGVSLTADAVLQEDYNKSVNVTTYPVEDGVDIAEHANVSAFTISIRGISSDASMSYFDLIESIANSAAGQLFGSSTKSQSVWDQLNKWADEGIALQVNAKFAKEGFKDKDGSIIPFVIESLGVPRNKDTGAAIEYQLTLRRIKRVTIGAADFVSTQLGPVDKGQQQLSANTKSGSVEGQATTTRTEAALRDNAAAQNRLGF